MHRMLAIARKETRQLLRDRVLLRVIVGMPLAMLLLFGYALNFTLKEVPLAVWDRAQDRISQSLRRALEAGALLAFGIGMVLLAARRFSKHLA